MSDQKIKLGVKIWPNGENIHPLKRVKFGIDPTGADLHLGHLVALRIVKKLLAQKKDVTLVIGTFTAGLGDPTGQEKTRPILSETQIQVNAASIKEQALNILGEVKVVENHVFSDRTSMSSFINNVATKFTVSELMARENFRTRGVGLHELLVPLAQAMDSVHLQTEIEVGGEDQEVNFALTRQLQKSFGQRPETAILVPIIRGIDGRKMSKSLGNCIFLNEPESAIFNKIMRIPDEVMDEWIPILTDMEKMPGHPQERKEVLANAIINQIKK